MKRRVWLKGSGPPPLARQLVIAAIQSLAAGRPELAWTVEELAVHMAAREYRVRAAVGWLEHQGRVVTVLRQRKTVNGRTYAVARYCLLWGANTPPTGPGCTGHLPAEGGTAGAVRVSAWGEGSSKGRYLASCVFEMLIR